MQWFVGISRRSARISCYLLADLHRFLVISHRSVRISCYLLIISRRYAWISCNLAQICKDYMFFYQRSVIIVFTCVASQYLFLCGVSCSFHISGYLLLISQLRTLRHVAWTVATQVLRPSRNFFERAALISISPIHPWTDGETWNPHLCLMCNSLWNGCN